MWFQEYNNSQVLPAQEALRKAEQDLEEAEEGLRKLERLYFEAMEGNGDHKGEEATNNMVSLLMIIFDGWILQSLF